MEYGESYLLEQLSSGDQAAYKDLFFKYYPKVRSFISAFIKDEDAAEDLSQDIFFKFWENRKNLTGINNLGAYFYVLSKNASLNYIRKSNRITHTDIPDDTGTDDVEQVYFSKEKELIIRLTVENMPPQRRHIFRLSRYYGKSNDEISELLGISKKTVENHLNLALTEIRKVLAVLILFF